MKTYTGVMVSAQATVQHIEVRALWGANVLSVTHMTPPRDFAIGEVAERAEAVHVGSNKRVDCTVPKSVLGAARAELVVVRGEQAFVILLPSMSGVVALPGSRALSVAEVKASGVAQPGDAGAFELLLLPGMRVQLELANGIGFLIVAGDAAPALLSPFEFASNTLLAASGISLALVAGTLGAAYYGHVGQNGDDDTELSRDQMMMMQKFLSASAEREQLQAQQTGAAGGESGSSGARAKDDEGSMGKRDVAVRNARYAVKGPSDNSDPHLAKEAALKDARDFGVIGVLASNFASDPDAPTAPWGQATSSGRDNVSAMGNLFGDVIGESGGNGALGLHGLDQGGGGHDEGIGLSDFGGLDHGRNGHGPSGVGTSIGHARPGRTPRVPTITQGITDVGGRLPASVIQRVVHQNFGRFRVCYDAGLRTNPGLGGRVVVKFIIDRTGAVSVANDGGSELGDKGVVKCVVQAFTSLSFPAPENGIVTVAYPFQFTPGN